MDIQKIYTPVMHKALQNALRNQFRIDYTPSGGLIKFIYNTKQGVIFKFNTWIGSAACMSAKTFINYDYNKAIKDLQAGYNKCLTDSTFRLKSEFYQDRYSKL